MDRRQTGTGTAKPDRRQALQKRQNMAPVNTPSQSSSERSRPRQSLGGLWGSVLASKPQAFNPDAVQTGKSGLRECQRYWEEHCSEKKCESREHPPWSVICGRGLPDAPVVLIEGHDERLGPRGLSMLSNMRENVMKIPKEKMYWLPVHKKTDCTLMESMTQGQFNALQPKAVLMMGRRPLDLFQVEGEVVDLGSTLNMKTLNGSIPVICTHHPNALLKKPELKREAFVHLQSFQRLLKRSGVL